MKSYLLSIIILIFASIISVYGQANSWNGITPLHSTRADVERLLGKPKDHGYETEFGSVGFSFIEQRCDRGWNVPADTVLNIYFASKSDVGKSSDELKLEENKFNIRRDDTYTGTWVNFEEGRTYRFHNVRQEFISTSYIPKRTDNDLRCNGFPPYAPDAQYFTMERYNFFEPGVSRRQSTNRLAERLDSLIIAVNNEARDSAKGYILVYFDKRLSFKAYRERLIQLESLVYRVRKIDENTLQFIEGGLRDRSEVEFYVLSRDLKPPAPVPSYPSPQFIIK